MTRWMYQTVQMKNKEEWLVIKEMNHMGERGWELAGITGLLAFFKRSY